ncbi:MAG: alternative ribosome rescue aminoacyl-tRNA hydrolase ArfB [Bacteroidota bacterium]
MTSLTDRDFDREFEIKAVRSSGPGGQHVNKTSTKVELRFNIDNSEVLIEEEKELLKQRLQNMITQSGDLIITSQESRSQQANRANAVNKFYETLAKGLKPVKKRKKTRPPAGLNEKRLEEKKKQSEKKDLRKPPELKNR